MNTQNTQTYMVSINPDKVLDKVIDVYHWIGNDLTTEEVVLVGQHLINLARRRATDVEQYYRENYVYNPDNIDQDIEDLYNEPEDEIFNS